MVRVFGLELLVFLLNAHIILNRIVTTKFRIRSFVVFFILVLPCVIIPLFFANEIIGDYFALCGTLLCYITPLFTLQGIRKIQIVYVVLLYSGAANSFLAACQWVIFIYLDVNNPIAITINIAIHFILLLLCILLTRNSAFNRLRLYIAQISMKLKILLLMSIWFCTAFAFFSSIYIANYPHNTSVILAEISAAGMIITVGIMWPFIIFGSSLNASYQVALSSMDKQIQAQTKQYEFVIQANNDIRKFRHDFENLKLGLIGFLKNENPQGALRHLEECEQLIQHEYISYQTGNLIADALLSEKQATAISNNIRIDFDGHIPPSGISSADMCVILGNLLDNALEACMELSGEKIVSISSSMNNGFLFLTISNPTKENITINNNTLVTSKTDKTNHGLGLISTKNAIRKYNGTLGNLAENRVFSAEVVLDLNIQI